MNENTFCPYEDFHQLGEEKYATITTEGVIRRLYAATGCNNMSELAAYLEVSASGISDARRRNRVPVAWFRTMLAKNPEISPVWLLTGQEDECWNKPFLLMQDLPHR